MKPARRGGGLDLLRGMRAHALGGRRRNPASGTGTSNLEPKDADSLEYSDRQTRLGIPSLKRDHEVQLNGIKLEVESKLKKQQPDHKQAEQKVLVQWITTLTRHWEPKD